MAQQPGAGRGGGPAPLVSPEVAADRRVTFRLRAPNAQEVALTRLGQRQPMVKDERGVWSVTTGPLDPDIYTYTFSVDGATFNDPSNSTLTTSYRSVQGLAEVEGRRQRRSRRTGEDSQRR